MRKTIFLLLLSSSVALAQKTVDWQPKEKNPLNFPLSDEGEIQYREVIPTKLSAGTILKRARTWAAKTYSSANEAVQQYDSTQGVMLMRGKVRYQTSQLQHEILLEVKEGRYRLTLEKPAAYGEFTTPVRIVKETAIHPYGINADDFYDIYVLVLGTSQIQTMGLMNRKKMAIKAANSQEKNLAEIKQTLEGLIASLKKAIDQEPGKSDW
jgi:hypothetical protein